MICWPHRDKVVETNILPSAFEQLNQSRLKSIKGLDCDDSFRKHVIVTYMCEKCGRERVVRK